MFYNWILFRANPSRGMSYQLPAIDMHIKNKLANVQEAMYSLVAPVSY
jgi:hypothetical protein